MTDNRNCRATGTAAAPAAASLTFRQLEESINKWAVDLDEQEKMFLNQAASVANWDRLLVTNGEKVRGISPHQFIVIVLK